jgi:hypothetical protein
VADSSLLWNGGLEIKTKEVMCELVFLNELGKGLKDFNLKVIK